MPFYEAIGNIDALAPSAIYLRPSFFMTRQEIEGQSSVLYRQLPHTQVKVDAFGSRTNVLH